MFIYLGQPYTHPDSNVMRGRYERGRSFLAHLIKTLPSNTTVYSPITHWHTVSVDFCLPNEWEFWQSHCLSMLRASSALFVLKLPGWEESVGLTEEINAAQQYNIPVEYHNWTKQKTVVAYNAKTK